MFDSILQTAAIAAGLATLPGSLELALLTAGALPRHRNVKIGARSATVRLAVIVPAHNEERLIERCISSLRLSAASLDRCDIIVIADNCGDATASRAATAGARVIERVDAERRGKGFALRYAFECLRGEGHDAYAVIDADTVVYPEVLPAIACAVADGADAVQVPYGVLDADRSSRARLMRVALLAFNRLRPRGRESLGLSAGILGNGFALSRRALDRVPYEAGSIVEDLEYHLALVRSGLRVRFVDCRGVLAEMPDRADAATSQRARWEGGRLRMICEHAPRLLHAVGRGEVRLLEPCLDLLLLPLALHCLLLLLAAAAATPFVAGCAALGLITVVTHIGVALLREGGDRRDLAALLHAPLYALWKLAVLPNIFRQANRASTWIRTERNLNGVHS